MLTWHALHIAATRLFPAKLRKHHQFEKTWAAFRKRGQIRMCAANTTHYRNVQQIRKSTEVIPRWKLPNCCCFGLWQQQAFVSSVYVNVTAWDRALLCAHAASDCCMHRELWWWRHDPPLCCAVCICILFPKFYAPVVKMCCQNVNVLLICLCLQVFS